MLGLAVCLDCCLLGNHEDLHLSPQNTHKNLDMACLRIHIKIVTPVPEDKERRLSGVAWETILAEWISSRLKGLLSHKNKVKNNRR